MNCFQWYSRSDRSIQEGGWALGGVDTTGTAVGKTISSQDFWQTASGKRYGVGEFFAYDMTNFRIRELSISYDIPMKSNKVIKGARISAMARNVAWLYREVHYSTFPVLASANVVRPGYEFG